MQLLCNSKGTTVFNMPTFCHKPPLKKELLKTYADGLSQVTAASQTQLLTRLRTLIDQMPVIRSSELKKFGIHRQILTRAVDCGFVSKIDRGLYIRPESLLDAKLRVILACRRVPHGVVCLESALRFHGIVSTESDVIWMAIDRKERRPALNGLNIRFVRFSGQALTQGVVNARIDGQPVRVYSVAKTVADCLKYRRRIGIETAMDAFQTSTGLNKCSRERLVHFANICRVARQVRLLYVRTKLSKTGSHRSKIKSSARRIQTGQLHVVPAGCFRVQLYGIDLASHYVAVIVWPSNILGIN